MPVIVALKQWGEEHFPDPAGPVIELRHRDCGGAVRVALQCSQLSNHETFAVTGPGARLAATRRASARR